MDLLPLDPAITAGQRLLVVDDDLELGELLVGVIGELGLEAVAASSAEGALASFEQSSPTLVLTDLMMPEVSGAELLARLKERNPTIPVLVMSVVNSVEQAVELLKSGADDYLVKPLDFQVLRARLETALRKLSSALDLEELERLIDRSFAPQVGIVWGTSAAMLRVAAQVPRIARTNASVLIRGESGTGKEMIARAIHHASRRAQQPLVSVSCASIPDGLWEREFFGHVKGAYSDAGSGGPGLVSVAGEGTLFLDEVGEIPLPMQAKMLRFLQEKEYRPVGSTVLKQANLRIIAATNRDLVQEIAAGRFREDLYYRLNVLQLELPPLRIRKQDLPHLAGFFLTRYAREFEKPVQGFSPRAIQRLSSHEFPGNVRELENVVQQALVNAQHTLVIAADLPVGDPTILEPSLGAEPAATSVEPARPAGGLAVRSELPYTEAKRQVSEEFERLYVQEVLARHGGNVSRAAAASGLPRKSLARVMARHGLGAGPDGTGGKPGRPRGESFVERIDPRRTAVVLP
jgi:two-component system response regulator HydG